MARLGMGVFAGLSLLVALMSLRVLVLPMEQAMPHMMHFLVATPWGLWGHVVLAPLVLLLAPLQMWTGLRHRLPVLHRWSGRLYALAVLLAATAGFALALAAESRASGFARAGFMVLAGGWFAATAMGVLRALQGDLARHRWWMQRSLALTFSAVSLRLIMGPLVAGGWTVAETYDVTAWGSWMLNLTVLELWQRRRRRVSALA